VKFGNPEFFFLLMLLPVFIGFFLWATQRKKAALASFAEPKLLEKLVPPATVARQVVKGTLLIAFFVFLVLVLVRPRFGTKMELFERRGIDLMVALDISESMLAEDMAPSRLDRAKHEISKLFDLLKGDRVGLIVFAGESFVQCPLTLDYGAAKMFLDAVNTGWVELQGTALADAIRQATEAFRSKAHKYKVLVLISDGEDHEGDAEEAARAAAAEGIIVYTVGVGSESGVPIPMNNAGGNVVYKKDNSGNLVMTKLDPVTLEKIAIEGHGKYFHAGTDLDLTRIMTEIERMEKKELGSARLNIYEERYQIFLFIALVLLIIEFFILDRVRRTEAWKGRFE
jgi:Ca-activated chloride channel homolog